MYAQNEKLVPIYIENEMKDSYISYAMSVIVGRALPDVRDGLKPVHRRILYAMKELNLEHTKPYKKSARIVGECFVSNTLILTDTGLVPIQDIKRGDKVYTQKGIQRVNELYEMPPAVLLNIELDNGISNIVTPSQKFKVINNNFQLEWKEASDLKPGDYLVLKAHYPAVKKHVKLQALCAHKQRYLNENIAYLLGIFMSEGSIETNKSRKNTYRITIACNERGIIEKVADILMAEFDYIPSITNRHYMYKNIKGQVCKNTRYQIRISKNHINNFLIENFNLAGLKAPTKRIPQQIFVSPPPVIYAFIAGLIDGDGSLHNKRTAIHYGSVSETMINQLQILLQHIGIFAIKHVDIDIDKAHIIDGRLVTANYPFYYLEFRGVNAQLLASRIVSYDKEKEIRRLRLTQSRLKKSMFETIPYAGEHIFGELTKAHLGGGWYVSAAGEKFRSGVKYATGTKIRYSKDLQEKPLRTSQIIEWGILEKLRKIQSPLYDFIRAVVENNIYFMRVRSVNVADAQRTYDIQVEGEHEFIANGMISHNCLGKYHPHGDMAVYDALVRMVQDFSLRYPLVDGQGNFGSVDGDAPAAQRYTEARMAAIADELLADIDKETVKFTPNFDETLEEPSVLPARLPNLLVNGSSGIAVGMATNIPPHNLNEIIDAIAELINNPEISIKDLMKIVKGPDFPTAGIICGREGIKQAYENGRGLLKIRARASIEKQKSGKESIIITQIPYQVNKSKLIENIAGLVQDKKIEGISDIRDESDREGMRIVIDVKRDQNPEIILNQLYKHTQMEESFGIIMLALVENTPKVLNLKQVIELYIKHRQEIVRRRTKFELDKAEKRAHILEGLKIAIEHLNQIIKTIKESKDPKSAQLALMKNFDLSEIQAQAILEMQLQRLTALERDKIENEYLELIKKIEMYKAILKSEKKILEIVKDEALELKKKYGDERRTEIVAKTEEIEIEDLIKEEDMVITISHAGYIKRLGIDSYRRQRRGGSGVAGIDIKEEDFVEHLFIASTHEYILFFTNKGRVHWLKVYEIPVASRSARGKAIINLLELSQGENISSYVRVKEFKEGNFVTMATKNGLIKKTDLMAYANPRKGGIIGITVEEGDELIEVELTDGKQDILLATHLGKAIRFPEAQVRDMGRGAKGVKGITLAKKDKVIAMQIAKKESTVLTVTSQGFAKRTAVEQYRKQSRGGKGIINVKVTKKNGEAVGLKTVNDTDEVMVITEKGMIVRCNVKDIRITGRSAQGVHIIKLDSGDKVSSIAHVVPEEKEEES